MVSHSRHESYLPIRPLAVLIEEKGDAIPWKNSTKVQLRSIEEAQLELELKLAESRASGSSPQAKTKKYVANKRWKALKGLLEKTYETCLEEYIKKKGVSCDKPGYSKLDGTSTVPLSPRDSSVAAEVMLETKELMSGLL
jgi:hypothetical protein